MINLIKKINFSYNKPLLIAEISGNHNGDKKKFLKLIESAYDNGADMVKIQTYEPIDITLNKKSKEFKIKGGIWNKNYLWDLYQKAQTPFSWHHEAFKIAKKRKKILFSSPFSIRAVDFLEKLDVPIYKVASFEITDLNLIDYIASKKKPIIISTGMSSIKEIKQAKKIINKYHNKIIILHCVSNYPTKLSDTNLYNIKKLKKLFGKNLIGISDHTDDIYSSIAAIPLGIVAIEKHYKLSSASKSADSLFSITPEQLKNLRHIIDGLYKSLRPLKKGKNKFLNIKFRRSIYAAEKIKKGETIKRNNIKVLRPNIGISASKYYKILGKKLKKEVLKDNPIYSKDII